jgi:hypothetical protein
MHVIAGEFDDANGTHGVVLNKFCGSSGDTIPIFDFA